jgi:hypothetical protein
MFSLVNNWPKGMVPRLRKQNQVVPKPGDSEWYIHISPSCSKGWRVTMLKRVIDLARGIWAGRGEIINTNPSQDLFVSPGVVIAPVVEFLIDPSQETDRTVS